MRGLTRSAGFGLRRGVSILAVSALLAAACGPPLSNLPREGDLHPRLSRYAYIEEGRLVSLVVDTTATRRREGVEFVPVGIGLANIGLKKLSLTRESFTLVDDEGNRYSMATVPEVRTLGSTLLYDWSLSENFFFGVCASRFGSWPEVESVFYPLPVPTSGSLRGSRSIVREELTLSRYSWTVDVIYFPAPEGQLLGRRYELWLDAEELPEPVFVKFRVK
jgi:hypothetical protein